MSSQATIAAPCEFKGKGLHLGLPVKVRLLPAPPDSGVVFRLVGNGRVCEIPADSSHIRAKTLRTALFADGSCVETVEHMLAAAYGLGVTNMVIEMDNVEPPACDGSAKEMCKSILDAGIVRQDRPRKLLELREPVSVIGEDGSSMTIFPGEGLTINYTLAGDGLPFQQVVYHHSPEAFLRQIAPARTFCREFEVEKLRSIPGVGQGATLENTLVVGRNDVDTKQKYPDELACHKILDLLGDLFLLGREIRGTIVCNRSGHACNHLLIRSIRGKEAGRGKGGHTMDIRQIRGTLPYGYPFLLVDRILDYENNVRVVGLKNVTINEPFFQGHFPDEPIMPGVLLIESLAQTGALMMYRDNRDRRVLFIGVDKVKFRSRVVPGDQLILEVRAVNMKPSFGIVKGVASVNGETACEAEMKFMMVNRETGTGGMGTGTGAEEQVNLTGR